MASTPTPICNFGWPAADFRLRGVDGKSWTLADIRGPRGTVVMFICNHCPYVKSAIGRIVRDVGELQQHHGIAAAAIMPNDTARYPEDGFGFMQQFAAAHRLPFPYLLDETQVVARTYDAVCTPDFFGFNRALELQYRGRLDAGRIEPVPGASRDLFDAMVQIAGTGQGPEEQISSMGCSIKWRAAG
ncbi:MAG: redoxin domain-containing protein [Azospirillum sp.]|nr:redoxin domain-containing protein [Azospirillum sp.]